MKKAIEILARQMARIPVPAHAREYSPDEIDAMAVAIVDYVEAAAAPGSLGLISFQNADDTEWQHPTREEAIEYHLSESEDAELVLYGKAGTLREHYAWAKAYLAEQPQSSVT